jgi:DNA-binding response OmpR family regulator
VYVLDQTIHASALIAGGSKVSRRALREAISGECQRVIEACDGAEAYELSRRYVPDVIVLDHGQTVEKLSNDRELAGVPVIRLNGPVELDELTARVRAALERA